jgi:hypothetical protein
MSAWPGLRLGAASLVLSAALLAQPPAPRIDGIAAREASLAVRLAGDGRPARLLALPPYAGDGDAAGGQVLWEGPLTDSQAEVPRAPEGRDLLYARFQLQDAATGEALGSPHWVDDLDALPAWTEAVAWPTSIKGVTCPVDIDDLVRLGVKHVDINILVSAVLDLTSPSPQVTWEVDGQRFGINTGYVQGLDDEIGRLTKAGICVTVILINGVPTAPDPANPFLHPRTDFADSPNHLGAFNLTDEAGYRSYRAVVEFLASRYSDPVGRYGRVSGWIIGNENQTHWEWANIGDATDAEVVADYSRALRVAWLAVRRYYAPARVYVSLDHCWNVAYGTNPLRAMPGRRFLELLNARAKAEGDFPWLVAFHPYPENLFEPRFWRDRTAVLGFDTPKITFRNLEVLPAFLRREEFLYHGEPRRTILSEQGFHCAETPEGEDNQAAAYAAAYYRTSRIAGIDAFMLHRHVDYRGEFGLHLGVWSASPTAPDPSVPDHKRRIWEVMRQADTGEWEAAFAFAKPIVGIADWSEIDPFEGAIPERSGLVAEPLDPTAVVCDLRALAAEAEHATCGDWRASWEVLPDGKLYPTLFQHPPLTGLGTAEAVFTLALPEPAPDEVLRFVARLAVLSPLSDGVRCSVLAGDEVLWDGAARPGDMVGVSADLTPYSGSTVRLVLRVDPLATNAGDWLNWAQPAVVREKAPPRPE